MILKMQQLAFPEMLVGKLTFKADMQIQKFVFDQRLFSFSEAMIVVKLVKQ